MPSFQRLPLSAVFTTAIISASSSGAPLGHPPENSENNIVLVLSKAGYSYALPEPGDISGLALCQKSRGMKNIRLAGTGSLEERKEVIQRNGQHKVIDPDTGEDLPDGGRPELHIFQERFQLGNGPLTEKVPGDARGVDLPPGDGGRSVSKNFDLQVFIRITDDS